MCCSTRPGDLPAPWNQAGKSRFRIAFLLHISPLQLQYSIIKARKTRKVAVQKGSMDLFTLSFDDNAYDDRSFFNTAPSLFP